MRDRQGFAAEFDQYKRDILEDKVNDYKDEQMSFANRQADLQKGSMSYEFNQLSRNDPIAYKKGIMDGSLQEQQDEEDSGFKNGGIVPLIPKAGVVKGAGTGTSDSISAKLPVGSAIIPANRVKELGIDFLNELRRLVPDNEVNEQETIPAKISNGEFHFTAEEVKFLGRKLIHNLIGDNGHMKEEMQEEMEEEMPKSKSLAPKMDMTKTPMEDEESEEQDDEEDEPMMMQGKIGYASGGVVHGQVKNGLLYAKNGDEDILSLKDRMSSSASLAADQAAQTRSNFAEPKSIAKESSLKQRLGLSPQNTVGDSSIVEQSLKQRMPSAEANAKIGAETIRSNLAGNTGQLKGRMDAAQTMARQGAQDLRGSTGLGFQGQNGEVTNFTGPKYGRISPSASINAQPSPIDQWAGGEGITGRDIINNVKSGANKVAQAAKEPLRNLGKVVTDPVNAGMAMDAVNQYLLERDINKGDVGLGTVIRGALSGASRIPKAIAEKVTGGIDPNSPAARVGEWAQKPLPIFESAQAQTQPQAKTINGLAPQQVKPDINTQWDQLTPQQQAAQIEEGKASVQRQLADKDYAPRAAELLNTEQARNALALGRPMTVANPDQSREQVSPQSLNSNTAYAETVNDIRNRLTPEQTKAISETGKMQRQLNVADINQKQRIDAENRDAPFNEYLRQKEAEGKQSLGLMRAGMQTAKDMSVLSPTYDVKYGPNGEIATIRNDASYNADPGAFSGLAPQSQSYAGLQQERAKQEASQLEKEQERADKLLPVQTINSETGQITTRQTLKDGVQSQNNNYLKALEDIASSDESTTEIGKQILKNYYPEKYAKLFPKG